jgi:hypothetical protein
MPPFMTVSILVFIICFIFFARGLASLEKKEYSIPTFSTKLITMEESELKTERDLEAQLSGVLKVLSLQEDNSNHETVYNLLLEEAHDNSLNFTEDDLSRLHNKMLDLQEVLRLEKVSEFKDMSLEGRKLIIYIVRDILRLYGYHLTVNLDGDIEKISDLSGVLVYSKTQLNFSEIQFKGLVFVLSFVFLALLICILIAKKKQLFEKDVRYDGLNKKRYA